MSMITGCPACGTLFKVVPDQLKISDGWVRCGHCSEVFDAAAHMRQLVDEDAVDAVPDASMTTTAPLTIEPPAPTAAPAPAVLPFPAPPPKADAPAPVSVLPSYYPDDAIEVREVDSPSQLDADSISGPTYRLRRNVDEPAAPDSVRREVEASRPRIDMLDDDDAEDEGPRSIYDPSLDKVTFVRAARRKAFWRRPAVRLVLMLIVLVLAAALGAQVSLQERDRLAAVYPQWRPALQVLCQAAGCKVGPQRRIDSIVIDSSGFARVRQDAYKLSVTLKNLASQPVAMPSLELTLTDSQDQPLVRKVLQARELGTAADTLAPTSDWSGSATIAVSGTADAARVAGYRLLAFYP
jgi:predicted Zn finger-like uncharacterized protein